MLFNQAEVLAAIEAADQAERRPSQVPDEPSAVSSIDSCDG